MGIRTETENSNEILAHRFNKESCHVYGLYTLMFLVVKLEATTAVL
jgi:hypothetical protein